MFLFPKSYAIAGIILEIAEWSSLFLVKQTDRCYILGSPKTA
ncbi:uncharacterized protein METZ01_LOCUS283510 [marine metagenome]|uniref:Uncharacterized protein n=1 Tax=marine metagenome TaxID=408172 RepID=A0A382L1L4_9ZZZZ